MINTSGNNSVAVLVSGGIDSCVLVSELLRRQQRVQPIYVQCGLFWEPVELHTLRRYLAAIRRPHMSELVTLDLPVCDLYSRHWSITGCDTPDSKTSDEAVELPGRNALLAVKAAIWCQMNQVPALALAVLGTSPFCDAKPPFFEQFSAVFCQNGFPHLNVVLPFAQMHKRDVMELGRDCPLELTFSCLAPVNGLHCGRCNKCAERQAAFRGVARPDLTPYALADRADRADRVGEAPA